MKDFDYDELLDSFIWIQPVNRDDFLKIKETLTRIGIVSRRSGDEKPTLWQSCHILHKRGRYAIVHFKQLFLLDGRTDRTELSQEDLDRTARIANLLQEWGLLKIIRPTETTNQVALTVIPYAEKTKWNLRSKHSIGQKRRRYEDE